MTAKTYSIDNASRTIKGDFAKMSEADRAIVQGLASLGYKFEQRKTRNGSKRTRSYFKANLIKEDYEIFELLEDKASGGSYGKASGFGSTIIKLGKFTDKHPEHKDALTEYRKLIIEDAVQARLYAQEVLSAA
ncbi:hypothetical protein [Adlercreutzia caecimuris]|uniref:hypothetical protein n=1 Tax=Adlercreutzia caecimuris TaxID=671266 RepID=UPI001364A9CA|nr:hypothetical protein [Adlercreutzia caecimuris]NBJ65725.1 hypothetical protein [Adlercreutzia caecimuris]